MLKIKEIAIFFFQKLDTSADPVLLYVIVTIMEIGTGKNLRLDRENAGNLKIQFEWVP